MAVANRLKVELLGEEKAVLAQHPTENPEAYDAYLKGLYHWNRRAEANLLEGIGHFERAIEKDPHFALPYAGIADCYSLLGWYGFRFPHEVYPRAKEAAEKALEIDKNLPEAYASLAFMVFYYDWNWPDAEKHFKRALELNPRYATAHHWYAEYLAAMGMVEQARKEAQRAVESDPLALIIKVLWGFALYFARQYDEAVEQYVRTLEVDPDFFPARYLLGLAYVQKSMYEEAIAELEKGWALLRGSPLVLATLAFVYAAGKRMDKLNVVTATLNRISPGKYVPSYFRAATHATLGEVDDAFESLARSYEDHDSWLVFLKVDPVWDSLRSDPRFGAMLEKMKLA